MFLIFKLLLFFCLFFLCVILNEVKNLLTSTNAFQILRVAQDDTMRVGSVLFIPQSIRWKYIDRTAYRNICP